MPTETLYVLAGVGAGFAFFMLALAFADMTWRPRGTTQRR